MKERLRKAGACSSARAGSLSAAGVSQHLGNGIQGRLFQAGWNFLPLQWGHCLTHSQARGAGADHIPGECLFWVLVYWKRLRSLSPNFRAGVGNIGQYSPPQLGSHNSLLLHWPTFSIEWKEASSRRTERLPLYPAAHPTLPKPSTEALFSGAGDLWMVTIVSQPIKGKWVEEISTGFYCQIFLSVGGQRTQTAQWRFELVQL